MSVSSAWKGEYTEPGGKNEVFDFLTEAGYMERKIYSDIDSLINEAAQLRERRK